MPEEKPKKKHKPRQTKHKMTEQDIQEFDELYQYVKKEIFKYDECQQLSRYAVLRLKGIREGKFIANNRTEDGANYSYLDVKHTFTFCKSTIINAIKNRHFNNEEHQMNYIMKIIENNLNEVYQRKKRGMLIQDKEEVAENMAREQEDSPTAFRFETYQNIYKPRVYTESEKKLWEMNKDKL